MAKIKIKDLDPIEELTDEMMGDIHGGITLTKLGLTSFDAWDPGAERNLSVNTSLISKSALAGFDAWVP